MPIYYAGSLALKSLHVFQTYRNMMGNTVKEQLEAGHNPFNFETMENFRDDRALVIMASPGMLQNGLSRDYFEAWCDDEKNGIIFTGYSVEGTLAKTVMNKPAEIQISEKVKKELRMAVDVISFSAHCDFTQTSDFIERLQPPNIVLVHGDQNEMAKLQKELNERYRERINVLSPRNC